MNLCIFQQNPFVDFVIFFCSASSFAVLLNETKKNIPLRKSFSVNWKKQLCENLINSYKIG